MRVLVYKRTHNGDPDDQGCFGCHDCMGTVRCRDFDAVIGVGGIGPTPRANGIAGQVNWVGIGPHKTTSRKRGPLVTFDHFLHFGTDGPDFRTLAPNLAKRMYSGRIRHVMDGLRKEEYREALKILRLAEREPASRRRPPSRRALSETARCGARGPTKRRRRSSNC